MPPENQPGHHPAKEQDKPDLDAFAAKLGADPKAAPVKAADHQPQPDPEREPLMVGLAMLPLRETVKGLERLERKLTQRLMARAGRGPKGR